MKRYLALGAMILALGQGYAQNSTNYLGKFESEKEKQAAISAYRAGEVTDGDWKGLKLQRFPRNLSSLENLAETGTNIVSQFKQGLYKVHPKFDSYGQEAKMRIVYNTLRKNLRYVQSPFDKIELSDKGIFPEDIQKDKEKYRIGIQTIEETFKQGKADCLELATILALHLTEAGVRSYPYILSTKSEGDHVITAFEYKLDGEDLFLFLDPSYWDELDFTENVTAVSKLTTDTNRITGGFILNGPDKKNSTP